MSDAPMVTGIEAGAEAEKPRQKTAAPRPVPVDRAGNPIDTARPKIENEDGSFSTERTIGISADIGDGERYYNIPTIVNGKQVTPDEAVKLFYDGKNPPVGTFATQAEADAAAPQRSEIIGEVRAGTPLSPSAKRALDRRGRRSPPVKEVLPEEDSWAALGKKLVENTPAMARQVGGGAVWALGEAKIPPPTGLGLDPNDPMLLEQQAVQDERAEAPGSLKKAGERIFANATEDLASNAPNVQPGSVKAYAYDISQAIVQMLPTITIGMVTKNPELGLTFMGGQVYAQKYGEARASGRAPDQASADAAFYSLAETVPERIPLGILMKRGGAFLPRVFKSAGAEGLQEMFTEVLQIAYDAGVVGEDMTWSEAWGRIKHAGIVGAGAGGGLAVGTHGADAMLNRRGTAPGPEGMEEPTGETVANVAPKRDREEEPVPEVPAALAVPPPAPARPGALSAAVESGKRVAEEVARVRQATQPEPTFLDTYPEDAAPLDVPPIEQALPEGPEGTSRDLEVPSETNGTGERADPVLLETPADVTANAERTVEPTEAQKEAGNYQKRHVAWQGLDIAIETEAGQERRGKDSDGEEWSVTMPAPYGYVKRSEGADGDHVDVYIGPEPQAPMVFVVDQIDARTGKFDEHKIMAGFPTREAAVATYQAAFSDGNGIDRVGAVTGMPVDDFKTWLKDGNTKKALAYRETSAEIAQRMKPADLPAYEAKSEAERQRIAETLPETKPGERIGEEVDEPTIDEMVQMEADMAEEEASRVTVTERADEADFVSSFPAPRDEALAREGRQTVLETERLGPEATPEEIDQYERESAEAIAAFHGEVRNEILDAMARYAAAAEAIENDIDPKNGKKPKTGDSRADMQRRMRIQMKEAQRDFAGTLGSYADHFGPEAKEALQRHMLDGFSMPEVAAEAGLTARQEGAAEAKARPSKTADRIADVMAETGIDLDAEGVADAQALVEQGRPPEEAVVEAAERAAIKYEAELAADAEAEGLERWAVPFDATEEEGAAAEPAREGGAATEADERAAPESEEARGEPAENRDEEESRRGLISYLRSRRESSVNVSRRGNGAPLNKSEREAFLAGYDARVSELEGIEAPPHDERNDKGARRSAYQRGAAAVGFHVGQFQKEGRKPKEKFSRRRAPIAANDNAVARADEALRDALRQSSEGQAFDAEMAMATADNAVWARGWRAFHDETSGEIQNEEGSSIATISRMKGGKWSLNVLGTDIAERFDSYPDAVAWVLGEDSGAMGDIRKFSRRGSRKAETVITLTGEEIGAAYSGQESMPALRRAAQRWYDDNLRGKTLTTKDGMTVSFSRKGRGKSTSGKGHFLLQAVPAIPDIVQKGEVVYRAPGTKEWQDERVVIAAPVDIAGTRATLAVSIHRTADGTYHYDFSTWEGTGAPGVSVPGGPAKDSRRPATESGPGDINLVVYDESIKTGLALETLEAKLRTVGLADKIRVRLVDVIRDEAGKAVRGAQGRYIRGLVDIALTAEDRGWVLDHEIVHGLRDLGLLRRSEWETLSRAAKADGARMEQVRKAYPELAPKALVEEAVADMFADWANGSTERKPFIRGIFERVRDFFRAFGRALSGASIRSSENIFGAIERGEIGSRTAPPAAIRPARFARERRAETPELDTFVKDMLPEIDSWARPLITDYIRYLPPDARAALETKISEAEDAAARVTALAEALEVTMRGSATPANLSKAIKDSTRRLRRTIAKMAEERQAEDEADFLDNMVQEPREPGRKRKERKGVSPQEARGALRFLRRAPALPDPGDYRWMSRFLLHPYQIATKDAQFADVFHWGAEFNRLRNEAQVLLGQVVEPYMVLGEKQRANINKVLEIGRLDSKDYSADETITVTNEGHRNAMLPVGESITLTDEERQGYLAVRGMFDRALLMFKQQVLKEANLGAAGDPRTPSGIRQFAQDQNEDLTSREREALERAADMVEEIERARRAGYVPFSRYGDYSITVTDSFGQTAYFAKVEKGIGDRERVAKLRKELEERFPRDQGFIVQKTQFRPKTDISGIQDIDFAVLDDMARRGGADAETVDAYHAAVQSSWTKEGFRSHFIESRNIPGYEQDFTRSVSDYIVGITGYLARRNAMDPMEQAVQRIDTAKQELRKYAKAYKAYIFNPQEEFGQWRQLMFYAYLAGNPSSAALNLTQVPLFTYPFMTMVTNPVKAAAALANASRITMKMFRPNMKAEFLNFDIDAAPADIREDLKALLRDGTLVPMVTLENMGVAQGRKKFLRGAGKQGRRLLEIAGTLFTSAERFNRIVTAVAALRLARNPKVMARAEKAFAASNIWQDLAPAPMPGTNTRGMSHSPQDLARFVIWETHFLQGKMNRPTALRGVGAPIAQFKSFTMNALQVQWRMATMYGAEGKRAFALNMLALFLAGGLFGLPFADDAKDWYEFFRRLFTDVDLDIEKELQEAAVDILGEEKGPAIGEAIRRGVLRQSGADMSQRIGMGRILPYSPPSPSYTGLASLEQQLEPLGIPAAVLVSGLRAADHMTNGDWATGLAEVSRYALSAGGANVAKAAAMDQEGLRTRNRALLIHPDDLQSSDIWLRAAGFQSSHIAREYEKNWMQTRADRAVAELQSNFYKRLAVADAAEDNAEYEATWAEIDAWNETQPEYMQITIDPNYLRRKVKEELDGRRKDRAAKGPRKASDERERIEEIMPR